MTKTELTVDNVVDQSKLEGSLAIIQDYLGEDWITQQEQDYTKNRSPDSELMDRFHPITPWICDHKKFFDQKISVNAESLIELERIASLITTFKDYENTEKFPERLKQKDAFTPTLFELQSADICRQLGYTVKFIKEDDKNEKNKTAEFIIENRKGEKYQVECKSIAQKTPNEKKDDAILSSAIDYAEKQGRKKKRYYSYLIKSEQNISFLNYKEIIDKVISSEKLLTANLLDTERRSLKLLRLKKTNILYSARFNGHKDQETTYDDIISKIQITAHQSIVTFSQLENTNICKNLFSFHVVNRRTRNIANSTISQFKAARKKISKDQNGIIFINIPPACFKDDTDNDYSGLLEEIQNRISKELKHDHNNKINFVVLMSSFIDISLDGHMTYARTRIIENKNNKQK